MNKKYVFVIVIVVIFLSLASLFCIEKYKNIKKTLLIKQELFDFTKNIDTTLLCTMCFGESKYKNITEEQKLFFAINYVILNIDNYKDKILEDKQEFVYTDQDSIYISIGHIEKSEINKVVYDVFGSDVKDIESFRFYDISNKMIALVPYMKIHFSFNSRELVNIEKISKNKYKVINKYTRSLNGKNNEFNVIYYIEKKEDKTVHKLSLTSFEICNSIMY